MAATPGQLLDAANAAGLGSLSDRQLMEIAVNLLLGNTGGVARTLYGNGAPAADLGSPGDTYVDNTSGALHWKSTSGWKP